MTVKREVRYLNKDFSSIRKELIEYAKTYFKDTINDFSPNDPASLFIEMSAYVGDVLSFYIDKQLKESLITQAEEKKNVIAGAQALGYKVAPTAPAKANVSLYQLIPSTGQGENVRPDWNYALKIDSGMIVESTGQNNTQFRTIEPIDFAVSSSINKTNVSVYQVDDSGVPTLYLLTKTIPVESGIESTYTITIGNVERFKKVLLNEKNIMYISSVVDSDNNPWYEVDYLAQDTIFESVSNIPAESDDYHQYDSTVPYLLKLKRVPRRFISRYRSDNTLELQFGSGTSDNPDEEIIPNLDNVGMFAPFNKSKLNYQYDISNFMYSDAYGQAPRNTTLTIKYIKGGSITDNVPSNTITSIRTKAFTGNMNGLDSDLVNTVQSSLAVNNLDAATGGRDELDIEEIRQNALANFATQNRSVTKTDYIVRSLSMPSKFGSIAKSYIAQDEQIHFEDRTSKIKNPLAMNMYILSYSDDGTLTHANNLIKNNLKSYLDKYRMSTDSINIKNAYIINIKVGFEITIVENYAAKEVLLNCIVELKKHFNIKNWQINQPIIKSDIIKKLHNVNGVKNVVDVNIYNTFDSTQGYWNNIYDIETATKNDVIYPSLDPSIFEVKYSASDISGKVVTQ